MRDLTSTEAAGTASEADSTPVQHVTGPWLDEILDLAVGTTIGTLLGSDRSDALVTWHRQALGHGRYPVDQHGQETPNPNVRDLPVIPMSLIAELLDDRGVAVPTRGAFRAWVAADLAAGGDGIDPVVELWRADNVADPDLSIDPAERRICGVPESIFGMLQPAEQKKVLDGRVIAPPQAPTFVAQWLVRNVFTTRLPIPARRNRAWMRTLIRIEQTWYQYSTTHVDEPPHWVARTDPEWMRAQLREALRGKWYVKVRQLKEGNQYSLKSWNPDTRTLGMVEDALADLLAVGTLSGTQAREIPDAYGKLHTAYPTPARWVLCRNGVLDVDTGKMLPNCPLWFGLSMIVADYDHNVDPYSDTAWLQMLRDQWSDDPGAITCLQQWFGYVLSGRTDLQKWMLILGPSGSGKSIIADVLGVLLGAVTATSLDELNSQFGLQQLYEAGGPLAVLSDIRFGTRDSSAAVKNLLGITGEDEISISRKYKTAVTTKLPVRFHGSANEMPRWSDNSSALARRSLLLETSRGFRGTGEEDPGLKNRIITNELGSVLRWAVEGLALLNASSGQFTRSAHANELLDEMALLSSAVRTFVEECCEIGTDEDFVDLDRLYRVWCRYAEENNTGRGMSQNKFRSAIRALYLDGVRPGQKKMPDGKPGKWSVVRGIKRAEVTFTDRSQYGEIKRTVSTEVNVSDPFGGTGSLN